MTPNPGDIIAGKYRVERVLGVGGMGVVVSVVHTDLLERRAIKLMRPESASSAHAVERFLREARAAARLKSEHIAKVHDTGRLESGEPFMVMEYLEGSDLSALVKTMRFLPVSDAAHYVLQACEALAEAHAAGIVHRDLKPANLFLTKDAAGAPIIKVLDFGISKASGPTQEAALGITRSDALLGSPLYMSPEQMRSPRDADARSDIWSIGAILYKLVTGHAPFMADSILALFLVVMDKPAAPPSTHNARVPPGLDAVILKCLSKAPADRYASVGDLAAALAPFAPEGARSLVARIAKVLAAAPSSPVQASTAGGDPESFISPLAALGLPGAASPLGDSARESALDPALDASGDAPTRNQPKSELLRDEAHETSGGSWGHTRGDAPSTASKRRRPGLLIAGLSAAAGAIATAIIAYFMLISGKASVAVEPASSAIAPAASIVGRALAAPSGASIAVEPAAASSSAPAAAPSSSPVSAPGLPPKPSSPAGTGAGPAPSPERSAAPRGSTTAAIPGKRPDTRSRNTF